MNDSPSIQSYMSLVPRTIGIDIGLSQADAIMRDHDIRHLPVLKAGKLVGIVSDRDVRLGRSFPGPGELTVEDVMTADPYVVGPDAELDDVVFQMVEHKYGSVVVQSSEGKVIGIFTTIDAMRALRHQLGKLSVRKAA